MKHFFAFFLIFSFNLSFGLLSSESIEIVKPNGITISYTYDALGRIIDLASSDGTIRYRYQYTDDVFSCIILAEDLNGGTFTQRIYDPQGCLLEETMANGLALVNRYDASGRRIAQTLPDSSQILYEYTSQGLSSITHGANTHRYTCDPSGNVLEEELIDGLGKLTHAINPLQRRFQTCSPYHEQSLERDANDSIHLFTSDFNQQTDHIYRYNDLYQLTSESGYFPRTYLYDSQDNRLAKDEEHYQIDDLNQLSSYIYDPNGNPIETIDGKTLFTYDALDRLIRVEREGLLIEYTYDPWHRRLSKSVFTEGEWKDTFFFYDGDNEIGAVNEDRQITQLRVLGQGRGAEIGAAVMIKLYGECYAPLHDLFGNIRALVSLQTHTVAESYYYSAFGEELILDAQGNPITSSALSNPWRFASKRIDEETSLIFYGRRYYDPSKGRWLTPDPYGLLEGANLYVFLLNDPLFRLDLYGLAIEMQDNEEDFSFREFFGKCYRGMGRIIHEIGQQIPIPYVQDGIKWLGCKIADDDRDPFQRSCMFTIEGKEYPLVKFISIPGVDNSYHSSKKMAANLSMHLGNSMVRGLHNASHGFGLDIIDCIREKCGFLTHPSKILLQEILSTIKDFGGAGAQGRIFLFGFSEGAAIIYSALINLIEEERKMISVYVFGPAKYISRSLANEAYNYVSERDPIGWVDPLGRLSKDCNIYILKPNSRWFDHGIFVSNHTYQKILGEIAKAIREELENN